MVVTWIPSSDLEAFRRTESSRLSCVSPGALFVLKYCSLTRCEGRFPGTFRRHILHNTSGLSHIRKYIWYKSVTEPDAWSQRKVLSTQLVKTARWIFVWGRYNFVRQLSLQIREAVLCECQNLFWVKTKEVCSNVSSDVFFLFKFSLFFPL